MTVSVQPRCVGSSLGRPLSVPPLPRHSPANTRHVWTFSPTWRENAKECDFRQHGNRMPSLIDGDAHEQKSLKELDVLERPGCDHLLSKDSSKADVLICCSETVCSAHRANPVSLRSTNSNPSKMSPLLPCKSCKVVCPPRDPGRERPLPDRIWAPPASR